MRYLLPILLIVLCVCAIVILALSAGNGSGGLDSGTLGPNGDKGGEGSGHDAPGTAGGALDDEYAAYAQAGVDLDNIRFLDTAITQEFPRAELRDLEFVMGSGRRQRVADFAPGKHIVLVVTRGNTTPICPFCSTQTADYVKRYDEIAERGAEVILAYPVQFDRDRGRLEPFLADARRRLVDPNRPIPFPIVFDVELEAVNTLGIRAKLAKPATYIIDREGRVRYAYVGADWSDRPSVTAVLIELGKLNEHESPSTDAPDTRPGDGKPAAPESAGDPDDSSSAPPP